MIALAVVAPLLGGITVAAAPADGPSGGMATGDTYPQTGTLTAAFDPGEAEPGDTVELFVESDRGGATIQVTSPQLTDAQLEEVIRQEDGRITLDGDGEFVTEIEIGGFLEEPGEYEFVFRDVDTGVETTAVLTVTGAAGDLSAQFEPSRVSAGGSVTLLVESGNAGGQIQVSSPQFSEEELVELAAFDGPGATLTLDGTQWTGEFRTFEDFFEPGEYEFVFRDTDTGAETTAVLTVTDEASTADDTPVPTEGEGTPAEVDEGGQTADGSQADGGSGGPDADLAGGTPTPERGFFVNGEGDPLGPLSNFLNLTVLGFLLSIVGIFYQLAEGR